MSWSRESRHTRGYGTAWDKLRLAVLKRDSYLCQCTHCKAEKRVTLASEVDHIVSKAKGGTDDPDNLQAISKACHKRKTIEEQGGTMKPRVKIGIDGFPIG